MKAIWKCQDSCLSNSRSYFVSIISINIRILALCTASAIFSTMAFSQHKTPTTTQVFTHENRVLALKALSQTVDARIASMKQIAKMTANDTHIHAWVEQGFDNAGANLLVNKLGFLVNEYGLTSASFADKNTHKYWNHEGFLRALSPEIDTWYFAYLQSQQQDLISVYHDKNKQRVDVYVNYQQLDGNGLSGIATSFDGVVDMLAQSSFAKSGEVYLVDQQGKVQIHANSEIAGSLNLASLIGAQHLLQLLNNQSAHFIDTQEHGVYGASLIPSMGWYVVVAL